MMNVAVFRPFVPMVMVCALIHLVACFLAAISDHPETAAPKFDGGLSEAATLHPTTSSPPRRRRDRSIG